MRINCLNCSTEFYAKPYEVKHGRKYCKLDCYLEYKNRKQHAQYPIKRSCKGCGEEFIIKQPRRAKKKYCSQSCAARQSNINRRGIKYDGSTHTFRRKLLDAYGHQCMICGYDKFVDSHHIDPVFNGGKNDIMNGILLCPNHHREADRELISQKQLRNFAKNYTKPMAN